MKTAPVSSVEAKMREITRIDGLRDEFLQFLVQTGFKREKSVETTLVNCKLQRFSLSVFVAT